MWENFRRQNTHNDDGLSPTQFYTQSYSTNQISLLKVIFIPLRVVCYKTVYKTLLSYQ
jgi:hypothetical protein